MTATLHVEIPTTFEPERRYAVRAVLVDLVGLDVEISASSRTAVTTLTCGPGPGLQLPDGLFSMPAREWLTPGSVRPLVEVDGLPTVAVPSQPSEVDPLGTAFFMLTRYEEVARPTADVHGRFPLSASVTREHLHRAFVDEHAERLWGRLARRWPALQRRTRSFQVLATHDIDHAFAYAGCRPRGMVIAAAKAVRRTHRPQEALKVAADWSAVRRGHLDRDPYATYDLIMDECERAGTRGTFYFIPDPDPAGRERDHLYTLDDPRVLDVLRAVDGRGHEIGIHPSYGSHLDQDQLGRELEGLRDALHRAGVQQPVLGGRQHYLRWSAPRTWRHWDALGLQYDSTVGYAEEPGFRAGVCHSYQVFDLEARQPLALRERPLVVMERTLESYLGLDVAGEPVRRRIADLARTTREHRGELVILWHNSSLADPRHRELYREALVA